MTFKQPLSVPPFPHQRNDDILVRQAKNSTKPSLCLICGDKACIINYGVLSCQSCKTFFRRNGFHRETVRPCLFKGPCEVNMETRRICTACRLGKCILVGMSPELIRKEDKRYPKYLSAMKSNKNTLVVSKQLESVSQLPMLNSTRNDRACLSASDWTLLSNIMHAHDTFSTIPQIQRIVEDLSTSSTAIHFDMKNAFDIINSLFTSMQLFVSSAPDFRILTLNEQNSLFERNLYGVTSLYSILLFRDSGIIDNTKCLESFNKIYGLEMIVQTKRIIKQLDLDSNIVKIMSMVSAFSSCYLVVNVDENIYNDSLLMGTHRLLGSQNVFVELLWKYMIDRYDFYDTVRRFARLITLLLDSVKYVAMSYTGNSIYRKLVDDAIIKTKETLIINQKQQTPLWGKI